MISQFASIYSRRYAPLILDLFDSFQKISQPSLKAKCSFWNTFVIRSILIYEVQCLKYVSYERDEYEKLVKIFKSLSLSSSISVSLSPSLCVLKHLIEKKTNSRASVGFQIYADMYPKFSRAFIFILYVYTLFYMPLLIRTRGKIANSRL